MSISDLVTENKVLPIMTNKSKTFHKNFFYSYIFYFKTRFWLVELENDYSFIEI